MVLSNRMLPGETRELTWADLDRESWTIRLHAKDAQTGYGRAVPLEGPLRGIIERRIKVRQLACPFIFHRSGRPIGDIRKAWTAACSAAGVSGRLIYDLRRTAVRNMVRAGVDPAVAMKISGHRTRAVFDRYNVVSEEDIRTAIRKTSTYVNSLPAEAKVVPIEGVLRSRQALT